LLEELLRVGLIKWQLLDFVSIIGRYFGEDSRTTVTNLVGDFSDFANAPGYSDETYENWLARSALGNYMNIA
jgi:hypothetical protein